MRIAVSADEVAGVAAEIGPELERRGHTVLLFGALTPGERADWAWSSEAAARAVADGEADQAVVACCASIAANKVDGVRAALCTDAVMADGARKWADANALALSLRLTSGPLLVEMLDAWFAGAPSTDPVDAANVAHVAEI